MKWHKLHIGLRTIKTTAAVILSMITVTYWGTTDSKLIFAMLGAMAAVQPTFKASVESCVSQTVGVLFGAAVGVLKYALFVGVIITGIEFFDKNDALISESNKEASVLYYPIHQATSIFFDGIRQEIHEPQTQPSSISILY